MGLCCSGVVVCQRPAVAAAICSVAAWPQACARHCCKCPCCLLVCAPAACNGGSGVMQCGCCCNGSTCCTCCGTSNCAGQVVRHCRQRCRCHWGTARHHVVVQNQLGSLRKLTLLLRWCVGDDGNCSAMVAGCVRECHAPQKCPKRQNFEQTNELFKLRSSHTCQRWRRH